MFNFSKKTWIIIAVVFVILVIIVIVIVTMNKAKAQSVTDSQNEGSLTNKLDILGAYKNESYPLSIYMKGFNVSRLQTQLNKRGANIKDDGYFGSVTEKAMLSILNKKSITEQELIDLEKEVITEYSGSTASSSLPDISTSEGLYEYIAILKQDLVDETYALSARGETTKNGIYRDYANRPNQAFITIYTMYKSKYSRDLATDVNDAKFYIGSSVDTDIIKKAKSLNLTSLA